MHLAGNAIYENTGYKPRPPRGLFELLGSRWPGWFVAGQRPQSLARARLQRAVGSLPFVFARRRVRKLANQRGQSLCPLARERQLREHLVVVGGVHEIRLAVLANPDTRLRTLDPPAADALPCCYALAHRIQSLLKEHIPYLVHRDLGRVFLYFACATVPQMVFNTYRASLAPASN